MADYVGWVVLGGIVVAVLGIYMLSNQVDRYMRETTQNIIDSNDMIAAQLKQLTRPSTEMSGSMGGGFVEKRCTQRRSRLAAVSTSGLTEQRASLGRRASDMLATG